MNAQFGTPGDDERTGHGSGRSWKFVVFVVITVLAIIALAIVVW